MSSRRHPGADVYVLPGLLVALVCACVSESVHAETQAHMRLGSTATAAAPLHSEEVLVGDKTVVVGFYMWPIRSDQLALLYVEGPIAADQTQLIAVPVGTTNASILKGFSMPDQVQPNQSWHEIQVAVRGTWELHIKTADAEGTLPLLVAGPPEIPLWLGWMIGLSPLMVLALFIRILRANVAEDPLTRAPWWNSSSSEATPQH